MDTRAVADRYKRIQWEDIGAEDIGGDGYRVEGPYRPGYRYTLGEDLTLVTYGLYNGVDDLDHAFHLFAAGVQISVNSVCIHSNGPCVSLDQPRVSWIECGPEGVLIEKSYP